MLPGMFDAIRSSRFELTSAGVQRTEYEPLESLALALAARAAAQLRHHRGRER